MTTVANGRCTSAPADVAIAIGTKPREATRTEQVRAADTDDSGGTHRVFPAFPYFVEMVNHQNTVEDRHTEKGDEAYTGRDAER